ncbi:hypothetical protein E4L96_15040 [Massilia arenosa]|uniref:Uncharacterized protein n=1 Tax=Zemynaea arenosa TaxID=2561931 RepID=A0A4Y9S6I9_9BURK|nr:hypothetical protein [Massilia arenosa]TFW17154.1 hypothetical protein E4L96_15040 [Massilia arenosa]
MATSQSNPFSVNVLPRVVPAGVPAWVPPPGYFADVPVTNKPNDVMPAIFAARPSDMDFPFDYWGASAFVRDFGPLGAQVYHSAGRESSTSNPNFQATVILDFQELKWTVANVPAQANLASTFVSGWAPDRTPYVNHSWNSLAEMPAAWGGGPKGSLVRVGTTAKNWDQDIHVMDLSQSVNGYRTLTTATQGITAAGNLSFNKAGTEGSPFYKVVIDEKRKGWWISIDGPADYTLFVAATGAVTRIPALGGNLQNSALAYWPEKDVLIAVNGGYEGGQYSSTAYRTIYVRDLASGTTQTLTTTGPVPALSNGYDGTVNTFHRIDSTGLQWVSELGCLVGLDESVTPPVVVKLTPPAAGPLAGPWVWSVVSTLRHWPDDVSGQTTLQTGVNWAWNKFRWIPSLHAFVYMSSRLRKPQVIKL